MFSLQYIPTLQPSEVSVSVTGLSNTVGPGGPYVETYDLDLVTSNIALFVSLSPGHCRGRFSDNGFISIQNVTKLQFHSKTYISVEELQNCISVRIYNKPSK